MRENTLVHLGTVHTAYPCRAEKGVLVYAFSELSTVALVLDPRRDLLVGNNIGQLKNNRY